MEILFIIGLIILSFNVFRFFLGNYSILKSDKPIWFKILNVVESTTINIVLLILILNYYN
jgi:hypothetical protein